MPIDMKIKVRVFATLRKYIPDLKLGQTKEMQVEEGVSIADLYKFLNIPVEEIKLAYVNGIFCEPDSILKEGDEIGIFPPIGGGNH